MSCVQNALPLPGSQEEGEFSSAACHLPCVREICGQRSNGETCCSIFCDFFSFLFFFYMPKAAALMIFFYTVFAFQSHKVSVVREDQLEGV